MQNFITADSIIAYAQCERKSFLLLYDNSQGINPDYSSVMEELTRGFKGRYLQNLLEQNSNVLLYSIKRMMEGQSILINANLEWDDLQAFVDILTLKKNASIEQIHYYEPTIIVGTHKISNEQIIRLKFVGYVLSRIQQREPLTGTIITADNRIHRIKIDGADRIISPILSALRGWRYSQKSPPVILNKHCQYCQFRIDCREKAIQVDHISLIRGTSRKEIELYNKRGIFTVTQLSYTYRPRKVRKNSSRSTPKYYLSLKALSIREQKIYVVQKPKIDLQETTIFLDVEGIPDRNFYYLIGMLIKSGSHFQKISLWADDEQEEENIWKKFLEIVQQYETFSLIHFGSYELDFISKMSKRYPNNDNGLIEHIKASSINVLSLIYANIYFPTYSNSLKDIGMFLGAKWSDETASGLQSLVWRHKWETTDDAIFKEKLIEYNIQDCFAAKAVFKTIIGILEGDNATSSENLSIVLAEDTNSIKQWRKFRKNKFVFEDMEFINQCAYFDYQREKVFFRETRQRKIVRKKHGTSLYLKTHSANKKVGVPFPKLCPRCSHTDLRPHTTEYKIVFDLKFFQHGIKRWITRYITRRVKCQLCHATSYSDDYLKIQGKYGRELKVWIVHQIVALRQSYNKVLENLSSIFDYNFDQRVALRAKSEMADYYTETYEIILSRLRTGKLVQVDETNVSIKGVNCYVWVFTNLEEVAYVFSQTREGTVLKEVLGGFKGVLVSDFYSVYDSVDCEQQKCLIHLIRDMNEDLLDYPFDEEYKEFIRDFSKLLKSIVTTIDEHGLKRKQLQKHKDNVGQFFDGIERMKPESPILERYRRRFLDNRAKLFTFLEHDDVPWNNNNAEHAVKEFAAYRKNTDGFYGEQGIKRHLVLLSVYATCKYKNLDFLKFLLSKEKDIDAFREYKK